LKTGGGSVEHALVTAETALEFLILGPLEVRDGERTVRLGSAKQRALLGVLLLHANETVSLGRLVDELWGEQPPATAGKLVQGYVHALRKQLGEGMLRTRPGGYLLSVAPRSLDLSEFEWLREAAGTAPPPQAHELRRRALALWRGPALADVSFEGPARHTIARLDDLRLATQIDQFDADLQRGGHAQVIGELERLVAEHPYQERLAAQLMLALYRAGRQADALALYRTVRRRLDEELGLEPGQELRDLEGRILRQDPALTLPPPPPATAPAVAPDAVRGPALAARAPARRGVRIAGVVAAATIAAVVAAAVVLGRTDGSSVTVAPNAVAFIDPATNRVDATVQVGIRPSAVAYGAGSLWVANLDDRAVTRIDPETRTVVRTIPLNASPDALAVGEDAVWVVNGRLGVLYRLDPAFNSVSGSRTLAERAITYVGGGVAVGGGDVWAAFADSTLARVDPTTLEAATARVTGAGPTSLVLAFGSVWVAISDASRGVQRFNPQAFREGPFDELTGGRTPSGLAAGAGSLWVSNTEDDSVTRIDPAVAGFGSSLPIGVGDGPTGVAFGAGAVWVANTAAGTVSRIDPESNEVVETIEIGNAPAGVAVANGVVAVSVQAP
jgi:YVTN family beta-propeller protein